MKIIVPHNMKLRPINDCFIEHEWLVELHNDSDVLRNLTNPNSITIDDHIKWWKNIRYDKNQLRKIFMIDGEPVGFAKFYNIDRTNSNCVLGADIHKKFRGQGFAKYMWTLMLEHCFDDMSLNRVSLTTASYNLIAQHIYKKLGFIEEGKLEQSLYRDGVYHDQICMRMLKSDWVSR